MDEKKVQAIMNLIIYGGDGKSSSVEAIQAAKEGNFELADEKIKAAEESLLQAHHTQTEMLTQEANGDSVEVSLLMVHGQDHLMTGMMFKDLAKENQPYHIQTFCFERDRGRISYDSKRAVKYSVRKRKDRI